MSSTDVKNSTNVDLFDTLQRNAIRYFTDNVNPANGLVADSTWGEAPSTPTPAASADFAIWTNRMSPWWTGYLVRGGLRKVDCPLCQFDFEPRYVTFDYGECSYAANTIDLVSLNSFQGTVTLEILNLPSGVTSQTATSVFLPRQSAASTALVLEASTRSALGDATITIRGRSGSIVHTVDHFISAVDQMPSCSS